MATVVVPPITVRKRIPKAAIDDVVRQIAAKFNPQKIILFGSYAYGRPHRESDVDLLVVMDTPGELRQAAEICQQIEYHFGLDLIVYTPGNLAARLKMGDSFLQDITFGGKVLYENTDC